MEPHWLSGQGSISVGGDSSATGGSTSETPKLPGIPDNENGIMFEKYADDATNTLWACSGMGGAPADQAATKSAIRAFDLKTGAAKAAYPMPYGAKSFCNDFAVDKAGDLYVADTVGGAIHRLKKGGETVPRGCGCLR